MNGISSATGLRFIDPLASNQVRRQPAIIEKGRLQRLGQGVKILGKNILIQQS